METKEKINLTVQTTIKAPLKKVWAAWTEPKHITKWNNASPDWHTPRAENDLRSGGRFLSRMESREGSEGFDFTGIYDKVEEFRLIEYTMDDGRKARISFDAIGNETTVRESFDAEGTNSVEMQRNGWQAILDNFKNYVEDLLSMEKLHYEILINAPVEKVYSAMLDKQHYSEWTKAFNPTSSFEGNWDQGSNIRFIGTDKNGKREGMISRITENTPNKKVSIQHLGMLDGDREITSGPEIEGWAGSMEEYSFSKEGNHTRVRVDLDMNKEYSEYMENTWPRALKKLKEICEK